MQYSIQEITAIISNGNGSINSFELSKILGQGHKEVLQRAFKELNIEDSRPDREISAEEARNELSAKLPYVHLKPAKHSKEITAYMFDESLILDIATSYDRKTRQTMREAYQAYKAKLTKIAVDPSTARQDALDALLGDFNTSYFDKKYKAIPFKDFILSAIAEHKVTGQEAVNILLDYYHSTVTKNIHNKDDRRDFFVSFQSGIEKAQAAVFQTKKIKEPATVIGSLESAKVVVEKKWHSLTKGNKTRAENTVSRLDEIIAELNVKYKRRGDIAFELHGIAKSERDTRKRLQAELEQLQIEIAELEAEKETLPF